MVNQDLTLQRRTKPAIDWHIKAGGIRGNETGFFRFFGVNVPPFTNENSLFPHLLTGVVPPMLTDAECKNATCSPEKKRARLACSGGLYLEISPAGSKRWFWKYRKDGKEARKARDAAKSHKSDGRDPVMVRKLENLKALTPAGDAFKATALEWYEMKLDSWNSHYAIREKRNLN